MVRAVSFSHPSGNIRIFVHFVAAINLCMSLSVSFWCFRVFSISAQTIPLLPSSPIRFVPFSICSSFTRMSDWKRASPSLFLLSILSRLSSIAHSFAAPPTVFHKCVAISSIPSQRSLAPHFRNTAILSNAGSILSGIHVISF